MYQFDCNYHAVPEYIHTPPQKGMEFPGGGFCKARKFKVSEVYEA